MKKCEKVYTNSEYKRLDIVMTVIYCYLEIHMNNFLYFEMSASFC